MRLIAKFAFTFSLFHLIIQPVSAAECSAKSGTTTVPLLELYTSEGCSSCPPADKWFSGLKASKTAVTPLAFHVDYWDYIGWKDAFAKAQFSDRQRRTAAFAGAGFVYTPQLVLGGRDFKGASDERLSQVVNNQQKIASKVNLSLNTLNQADGEITLHATAQPVSLEEAKNAEVFVAIYENNLSSKVMTGENNGRELKHDYVVRQLFGPFTANDTNFSKNFTLNKDWGKHDAGAVMFVQNAHTGEILQSLQLPFCH